MKKYRGLVWFASLRNDWTFEIQLLSVIRRFKDGITFFECKVNYDRYESYHTPAFQIELTILNLYNHIWVYKTNDHEREYYR